MKPVGQVDILAGTASSLAGASANFSLGVGVGPSSPGRKAAVRVRTSSAPSKIPQRPTGVVGPSAQAAAPDGRQTAWPNPAPATTAQEGAPATAAAHVPERPQSTGSMSFDATSGASAANATGFAAVPPPAQTAASGTATQPQPPMPVPTFAVGAADPQPGGLRTPRGGRMRANRQKTNATSPLIFAAPGAATGSSAGQLFSPGLGLGGLEAMTPMDENTYQKLVSKPASMGMLDSESPMDITPQGSTVSAASNVFVFSPLVGASFGGQPAGSGAAGASAGGAGLASSASSAPTPFQGFAAAVAAAVQPSGSSTSAAEGVPAPGAGAPAPSGSGAASRTSSIGGGSASGSGLRFSIQLPIPGAREVHDMFTSAASSSGVPAAGNGSKGGAPPAAPGAVGSSAQGAQASKTTAAVSSAAAKKLPDSDSQGAKMAAAVAAAAAKKLPETDGPGPAAAGAAAKAGSAGGAGSGAANQTGNDCQPPKDNAAKAARISVDSGGSASVAASRSGVPAVPAVTTFATAAETSSSALPVQQAAVAVSASAVASTAAALGMAAANAAAAASSGSAEAAASPPDFLAAVAEQLENMARRTREAAAAAAAAQASAGCFNAAAVVEAAVASLASESNPAIRSVIEIMLRPGAIDAKVAAAAAATRASASDAAPGLAAAVACMLGALKLDESRATGTEVAAAIAAAVGAADRSKSSDGSRGSSAGGIPSVPFVFGGASSGGSVTAGSSQGGTAAAPAPAAPSVAPATGAAAFGAGPAVPTAAPVAAARQAPPQQQPAAVPYVFGAPNFNSHVGPQATATAAAPAAAPAAPAGFGSSASFGRAHSVPGAPQAERPSSTGSATSLPFMFSANVTPQAQQPAAGQHASSMPQTAASFASAGASPMSTTPMSASQQSMQQQQPTAPASSSGWPAGVPAVTAAAAPPGGEAFQFTVGDAAAGGGATPARVGGRARTKITPRKTRGPVPMDTGGASRSSAGGVGDSTAATAATAPAPPPAGPATGPFADRPSGSSASAGGAAAQQQRASQPQGSSGDADAGLDTAALQAVRLKRTADEKKQYGNQKYELSDFKSAERWYSEAIDLLEQQMPQLSLNRDRLQQLFPSLKTEVAVLYSNRSGARLMTSKPHSALADALRAMELDPKFMRAASRAATCHCRLGDFAAAHRIIDAAMDRCSAASGHYQDMLKKLNEVVDLGSRARAATAAAVSAVSSGSREKLQEAADQLAAIRDPVGYCDVVAAARAVLALRLGFPREVLTLVAPHPEVPVQQRAAPWRLWLTVQAHYFKGDLQEALVTCKELQLAQEAAGRQVSEGGSAGASGQEQDGQAAAGAAAYTTSAHVTVPPAAVLGELGESLQQLLKLKEEGNAAIKANKHAEAAESYSRALGLGCCPAYAAVLHANRAAAHAGQGALADAVADCGRAKALDPSYYKANSRLAAYMIELRRPEEATGLLEPLVKLASQSNGAGPRPEELTMIKERLSEARAAAAWQKTPQHYKLLCLTNSCSEDDVKKAYRRLALKHHPDKALAAVKVSLTLPGRAGGAPYSGPLACSNEIETRVREEATALFNYINQAHEELSDKSRRRKVDQLLEAEQPPHSGRYGSSSSQYGGGWHNGGGSRYSGFSSFYGMDPFFFHRPGGAGPAGGYGGYGSYGGVRPTSARQTSAASGANGSGAARSSGNNAGASRNASGAAGGGGGAGGGYGGYGRTGGGGGAAAGARPAAGPGRKWWEGGNDYSDDDDEDTFNF